MLALEFRQDRTKLQELYFSPSANFIIHFRLSFLAELWEENDPVLGDLVGHVYNFLKRKTVCP